MAQDTIQTAKLIFSFNSDSLTADGKFELDSIYQVIAEIEPDSIEFLFIERRRRVESYHLAFWRLKAIQDYYNKQCPNWNFTCEGKVEYFEEEIKQENMHLWWPYKLVILVW
ncbi:MAG: hypothetical protein R2780_13125 [Crocinitomicaceae bacterium]